MIAEVASRFASVDKFTSLVGTIGFKLQKKVVAAHTVVHQRVTPFTG